jgi:hypothetical protein
VLAAGAAIFQTWTYLRGPELQLFPPDGILVLPFEYSKGRRFVRFETRMSYINTAEPGYNAVLRHEALTYSLAGREYLQVWNQFVKLRNEGNTIKLDPDSSAVPLPLIAASATSHETYFWPFQNVCQENTRNCNEWANFMSWEAFIDSLKIGERIQFVLVAEVYGHHDLTVTCSATVTRSAMTQLKTLGWYTLLCQ